MKKMKLFPRTFIYTLVLLVLITLIGHALIYILMPIVYISQKEDITRDINHEMVQLLQIMEPDKVGSAVEAYTQKNQVFAKLNYNGKMYAYGAVYVQDIANEENSQYYFEASPFETEMLDSDKLPPGTIKTEKGIRSITYSSSSQFVRTEESFSSINGKDSSLETTITLQPVNEAKGVVLDLLPFSLLICLIVSVGFALVYSQKITRPISRISKATERMEKLDKLAFCEISSQDEIGQLAENVNSLYQSLLSTIDSLQKEIDHVSEIELSKVDFMRAASHELKTPVTAVSFMLDNMMMGVGKFKDYEVFLPKCRELVENLSDMICDILDTSKLNFSNRAEEVQNILLSDILAKVAEPYLLIAKNKGLLTVINISKAFTADVPPKAFSNVLSNVLSNAVNYTTAGGSIHVFFRTQSLIIENECTPLSPVQLEHVFKPFYRPDFSRARNTGGSGLGLYIVAQILSAYQIQYSFIPYQHGMRFTIIF
ncbi:HAMP domain-containing sensor histidine kinase [Paenibacillus graminis]|uniref:sensor histidine kinase n=1 Tax=Paenibacillus graminis TaxID=189425 RepID=UPI002DBAE163|nr:HAMP domain-containing sensor histidine kinase [Paenibacillus graminis]MEC0168825.1 HAMP domain-containing sensor histidine kinase [Paenibacillus graminis]